MLAGTVGGVGFGRLSRAQQEPSDETNPDAIQDVASEEKPDTPEYEEVGDDLSDESRGACRLTHVARDLPDDGVQHPAPVKWEARNEIEDAQQDVGHCQVE